MSDINEKEIEIEVEIKKRFDAISRFELSSEVTADDLKRTRQKIIEQMSEQEISRQNVWRIIMKSKLSKIAAVLVIALGIVGLSNLFTQSGSGFAFADVIEPILNARNVIYSIILGQESKDSPVIRDMIMGSRIRRTLSNVEGVSIIDLETSKILSLDPEKKKAIYIDLKGLPKIPNPMANLRNLITIVQNSPELTVEELDEQEIDGQTAIGFHAQHPKMEMTIWADPVTALPIRIELQEGQMFLICKDYLFDVEMDGALFSMEVPEGYTEQKTEMDLFASTEEDFIEGLRVWTEVLLDGEFPASIAVEDYVKQTPMIKEKFDALNLSDEEELDLGMKIQKVLLFTRFFQGEGKWHYAGAGVELDDGDAAIFWYQPKNSQTWRVIYGDLTIEDVAPEDLPEPLSAEEAAASAIAHAAERDSEFGGRQEDRWHITASDDIVVHSYIDIMKGPADTTIIPITLPYPSGDLQSVTCNGQVIAYSKIDDGQYELELPAEGFKFGRTKIECVWNLPLDSLETAEYGYQVNLKFLMPVNAYKLTVILADDCGFVNTQDPSQRQSVPFTFNSSLFKREGASYWANTAPFKTEMGACGIAIQKQP